MEDLFADEMQTKVNKKSKKGLVISIIVFIIALILVASVAIFLRANNNISGKAALLEMIDKYQPDEYFDLDGFEKIIDKQNKSVYETDSNIKLDDGTDSKGEINPEMTKKRILNNVALKDLNLNVKSAIDSPGKKGKTNITVKFGDNIIWDLALVDLGDTLAIGEPTYFKEYVGIEKASLNSLPNWLPQREETLEEEQSRKNIIENLEYNINQDKELNPAKEIKNILSIYKGRLKDKLSELPEDSVTMERKVPVLYRDKDVRANVIKIDISKEEYERMFEDILENTQKEIATSDNSFPAIKFLDSVKNTILGGVLNDFILPVDIDDIQKISGMKLLRSNTNNNEETSNSANNVNNINKEQNAPENGEGNTEEIPLSNLNNNAEGQVEAQALPANSSEVIEGSLKADANEIVNQATNSNINTDSAENTTASPDNNIVNQTVGNENTEAVSGEPEEINIDDNTINLNENDHSDNIQIKIYLIGDSDIKIDKEDSGAVMESIQMHKSKDEEDLTEIIYAKNSAVNSDIRLKLTKTADSGTVYNKMDLKVTPKIITETSKEKTVIASLNRSQNLESANISLEYDIEKQEGKIVKKANIAKNIKFSNNVNISIDRAILKLNTLGTLEVRKMMKDLIYPIIKKVTTEKLYRLENLGAVGAASKITDDSNVNNNANNANNNANSNSNNSNSSNNSDNTENNSENKQEDNDKENN